MQFDSKEQKDLCLKLLSQVPVQTTIDGLFGGPTPELKALVQAMNAAEIAEPTKPELVQE